MAKPDGLDPFFLTVPERSRVVQYKITSTCLFYPHCNYIVIKAI